MATHKHLFIDRMNYLKIIVTALKRAQISNTIGITEITLPTQFW